MPGTAAVPERFYPNFALECGARGLLRAPQSPSGEQPDGSALIVRCLIIVMARPLFICFDFILDSLDCFF